MAKNMPVLGNIIPGRTFVYMMIGLLIVSLLTAGTLFFMKVLPGIRAKRPVQTQYYVIIAISVLFAVLSIIAIW